MVPWLHTLNARSQCNLIPYPEAINCSCASTVFSLMDNDLFIKLCGDLTFMLFCFIVGRRGFFFCREVFHNPGKVVASSVTLSSLEDAYLVGDKGTDHSLFVHSWQCAWSCARHEKDTLTPKKLLSLIPVSLTSLQSTSLGYGRSLSGGKSQVRSSPMCHLPLKGCMCLCSSGIVPTTEPSPLLWAVLPTMPVLPCLFALQTG